MIPFILSILSTILIFIIFRLFKRFGIDTFQAIVVNYFTAAGIGFALYGNTWTPLAWEQNSWLGYAVLTSVLFICLFMLMGVSSQENGVASTSVAVKMSMAISIILLVLYYSESPSFIKIFGIVLAFISVILVSWSKQKSKSNHKWMLIVLFFGGGCLDFVLNYVQENQLDILKPSLFSAISFGIAGCIGTSILVFNIIKGKTHLKWKNVIAGIVLGIPNFFSIYFLLLSYTSTGWTDTTVLSLLNVSVVLGSALVGLLIFKESTTLKKIIGLIIALAAIITLYIAEQ